MSSFAVYGVVVKIPVSRWWFSIFLWSTERRKWPAVVYGLWAAELRAKVPSAAVVWAGLRAAQVAGVCGLREICGTPGGLSGGRGHAGGRLPAEVGGRCGQKGVDKSVNSVRAWLPLTSGWLVSLLCRPSLVPPCFFAGFSFLCWSRMRVCVCWS